MATAELKCTTCEYSSPAEPMMKHLGSVRHKTVMDSKHDEIVSCEECSNNNIHQLQIIRFGGDDMVLLCDPCYNKLYKGIDRPSSAYSLKNGTILTFWDRYRKVRDCVCSKCHKDSDLLVDQNSTVLCKDCIKILKKDPNNFVNEDSGKFVYYLLKIKEPKGNNNNKQGKKFSRRKGRSKRGRAGNKNGKKSGSSSKSSSKDSDKNSTRKQNEPKGVLKKINATMYQNRKENTKIESSTKLSLRSFSGFKAVTSDTNLAATIEQNLDRNITKNKSATNLSTANSNNKQISMAMHNLNKPGELMRTLSTTDLTQKKQQNSKKNKKDNVNKDEKKNDKKSNSKKETVKTDKSKKNDTKNVNSKKENAKPDNSKKENNKQNSKKSNEKKEPSWGASSGWEVSWDASPSPVPTIAAAEPPSTASKKKNKKNKSKNETTPTPTQIKESSPSKKNKNPVKKTKKTNELIEEGIQNRKFSRFTPKLTFPDLKTYLDTFSQAMFLEQKLENEFLEDFEISWPNNIKERVFLVDFKSKNNNELERLILPHMSGKTKNPFNERQPLMLTTIDESLVWYTFIKEVKEERNRIRLLLELFPWNKMDLPTKIGSEHMKLLPVSVQASRIIFSMTRVTNPKFIDLLLGNKKLKPMYFNNRLKFSKDTLNKSQRNAIEYVLNNPVTVIQGPPGTGKTSTIEELIHQIITNFHSFPILCVAASNIAIDNITEKFINNKDGIKVIRILSDRKESEYNLSHPLGKVCLHNIVYDMLPADLKKEEELLRSRGKSALSPKNEKRLYLAKSALVNKIIAQAQIICTTNITAGGRQLKSVKEIPTVIMDESTQSSEATTLVPLSLPGIKSFLFVGDEKQLSSFSNIPQLEMSLFERILLNKTCGEPQMLDTQYRMHPQISEFSIHHVYNDKLLNGVTSKQKEWPGIKYPLFFYQCDLGYEERAFNEPKIGGNNSGGFSYNNKYECEAILEIIYKLLTEKKVNLSQIGIITAYSAQRDLLSEILLNDPIINPLNKAMIRETDEDEFLNKNDYPGHNLQSHVVNIVNHLQIATVDSFQGHEKEFIIFSCVRNNADNKIGFLSDKRRLNVALTRAKNGLIIVGNKNVLESGKTIWTDFIKFLEKKELIFEDLNSF